LAKVALGAQNTSYAIKVIEKEQILFLENIEVLKMGVKSNHHSKAAKITGIFLNP
jgi:hypothetical protein